MIRTGIGYDVHRFASGRRLVLGGVTIKSAAGLLGHSDADVLCHAVIDALLGAAAEGDIGEHFPDTDKSWKNADSVKMLKIAGGKLQRRKISIVNVDATILAQKPRIAPYRARMRVNIARALGISLEQVSVKATTLEGLGALGRGEGIAAMAVATVEERCR